MLILKSSKENIIKGGIIFASGDVIASLIIDEFSVLRCIGMLLTGAFIYAFEIPNYFSWIELKTNSFNKLKGYLLKVLLAVAYFNPIWIFRHMIIIKIISGFRINEIGFNLFLIALKSFAYNLPFALVVNFIIQNKINLKYRFIASAIFSALMAIYYALSLRWL